MPSPRDAILFLCTGNSARSILAEAIANGRYAHRLVAQSAGSMPRGAVHEAALAALRRHGILTAGLASKSWDEVRDECFDLVVTLCDEAAAETCPSWPGAPRQAHWSLPDPPAAPDPPTVFERVLAALDAGLRRLAGDADLDTRVAEAGDAVRRTLASKADG